jgi:3-hydroxybutyryl-CoA dehydrogenase
MDVDEISKVAVLGAGIMGHGIAQAFAMGGLEVSLYDVHRQVLDDAVARIRQNLRLFSEEGLIREDEIEGVVNGIRPTLNLREAVCDAQFIVEAAPEDLPLKQSLMEEVESYCSRESILASNTSSLILAEIGARVSRKDRMVITHWFNPPHIVPAVEVVKGRDTSQETLETTYRLHLRIKKQPVKILKELPGFIINRIQVAMVREVFDLFERGIASAEDIDRAVRGSIGFRLASIGPLLTADLGGLRLWLRVCENLLPEINSSTEPPRALRRLVEEGHDGIKSGKGFYDYRTDISMSRLDEVIRRRDREFLRRLKQLYWDQSS